MKKHYREPQHSQTWQELKPANPDSIISWAFYIGGMFFHAAIISAGVVAGIGLLMMFM